jgi:RNA polymerase sigma factor (sigma-70 family)
MQPPKTENWQKLVEENLSLAYWLVQSAIKGVRCRHRIGDFESVALEGLVKAARGYDPERRSRDGKTIKFCTFATNVIKKHIASHLRYRKAMKNQPCTVLTDTAARFDSSPLEAKEFAHTLLADTAVTPKQRQAVELYYIYGWQLQAIADAMGITASRAGALVQDALTKMRQLARLMLENEPIRLPEPVVKTVVEVTCDTCGRLFVPCSKMNRYCRTECRMVADRKVKREYRRRTFVPKTDRKRRVGPELG